MGITLTSPGDNLSPGNVEHFVLYKTDMSPCVRRVRITLIEKGLDFDVVDVDLPNMQQRTPVYLALNPNGFVPTLSHKGHIVFESGVINEYLEDQFPEMALMPTDAYERAQVRMWMAAEGAMAKVFRGVMYQRLMAPIHHLSRSHEEALEIAAKASDDPQDISWESRIWHLQVLTPEEEARDEARLYAWLDTVERALDGKNYLVGDSFSQADISMYPRIAMYNQLGSDIDPGRYPNVLRWMAALAKRPSFEASQTPEARKLAAFSSSSLLKKVRAALKVEPQQRSLVQRLTLWGVARLLRRMLGVEALLGSNTDVRPLYKPVDEGGPEARNLGQAGQQRPFAGDVTLYGDRRSPLNMRVSLLLERLGVAFTSVDINPGSGQTLPETLLACNPQQELPVITHGQRVVSGADTIADYVCQLIEGGHRLWRAQDSIAASRSRMWLALEAGSHKEFTPLWQHYVCAEESVYFIASEETALNRIHGQLGILDSALGSSSFLCADSPGYADIVWYSRLIALQQVPQFTIDALPALQAWFQKMDAELQGNLALIDAR
jgi:glutathione S-transferase